MRFLTIAAFFAAAALAAEVKFSVDKVTPSIDSGKPVFSYSDDPFLIGNDGGPTGGFAVWEFENGELKEVERKDTGRTKLVEVIYLFEEYYEMIVTLSISDSILRFFGEDGKQIDGEVKIWGDYSSWCFWRSESKKQYFYLFGKGAARLFLVRGKKNSVEVLEVQAFQVPIEASTCTVSSITASESTAPPGPIDQLGKLSDEVVGLSLYIGNKKSEYLLVALPESLEIYRYTTSKLTLLVTATFSEEMELGDIAVYQSKTDAYPDGAISYAMETDTGKAFGISSLTPLFTALSVKPNTSFDPSKQSCKTCTPKVNPISCPRVRDCSTQGFCTSSTSCSCFSGFSGATCATITCTNNCFSHGKCVAANECECRPPWGGPDCSFLMVEAAYETDQNGGDGDDPAIWIAPGKTNNGSSRIITTTKSELGSGFGVFDLTGKKLQTFPAEEPNNVDVLYGVKVGNRMVDLAVAACRGDNTICMLEISPSGELISIPGGAQSTTVEDYEVYGSCVYQSSKTNKQYIFVNSKTSEYLQFELTSTPSGSLQTTLVRRFQGGSGGQVEGCVADNQNDYIFIGEEPFGLWRFDVEPNSTTPGFLIDSVGGKLYADVEGVTLVYGKTAMEGFVLVSCQGLSSYNVYKRAPPHEYVMTFSIQAGKVDRVTNTDGITAVGTALGEFEAGLVVVHDDVNENSDGSIQAEASFKLVGLGDILGADVIKSLGLMDNVDTEWDPRIV
ncbi:thermostable phytase [Choiromyces venosus 120613-1]|uniref:Thermostable phytase n=1 Tax=Choiromyces venosus 120613-1 TaxID=1336337 RepID=A0A3N4K4A8_9PEZI|nr:thermostable phytase [Choiromyces venosus 120613-1]